MPSAVIWQPVAALPLRYAIQSDAPIALASARQLFSPWLLQTPDARCERRWRLELGDDESWSVTEAGDEVGNEAPELWRDRSLATILAQVEYAALHHLVAHLPPDFIGLHGALLSRDFGGQKRGIVIVGPKEAGKSTLSCALWRAGWTLHCDDFMLLDQNSRAHPTARRVSLRAGSRELLGDLWERARQTPSARATATGLAFHPHELSDAVPESVKALPLGALIFLNRRGAQVAPAQTAPLAGVEAAWALLPYSTLLLDESGRELTHERADWGVGLGVLAARVADLPIYDLGRAQPEAMVRAVETLVG